MEIDTRPTDLSTRYHEVQQFYAEHMQLLDDGDAAGWAATFTEDGVFEPPAPRPAVRGRADLTAGAAGAAAERRRAGEVHRHWHGMLALRPGPGDGALAVRCYALVVATSADGTTRLHRSCVCEDELVRGGDGWLVRHRRVTADGVPAPLPGG